MSCGPAAIEQTGSSKQHRTSANRADSPDSSGNLFQPANDVRVYFILLDSAATGDEQGVDFAAHFSKSFMRGDPNTAVCHERSLGRGADDFDGINWTCAGVCPAIHVRRAGEDLKWSDEVEDLRSRSGDENDTPGCSSCAAVTLISSHSS